LIILGKTHIYWYSQIKRGGETSMMKKIVWVVVSCLMALSLVMASCGPAEEEEEAVTEEEEEEVVVEEE
jgi:hypothetical protein